jgi:hypothetical protein
VMVFVVLQVSALSLLRLKLSLYKKKMTTDVREILN